MKLQRVKGMYDIVPEATPLWQRVERTATTLLQDYGYGEIRLPLLERTEVFARAIGQGTDVVSKEMYSFEDRNGESLTLRPEGTAGCVRAALQNGLLKGNAVKLWYAGPMFRHENVQRGRNRQFYQVGGEAFGLAGPDIDAELIALLARLWRQLGLNGVRLEINSLGTTASRARHREDLLAYLGQREDELDEDSQRRLDTNPLRILDSKNPQMASLIAGAPALLDYLDHESRAHFERLQALLNAFDVKFEINPLLVRGLDYYSRTVFEFKTEELGSQGTICAGGRYDTLVETLGGKPTPAVGFSLGVDRVVELLEVQGVQQEASAPHVYVVAVGDEAEFRAMSMAEQLRSAVPGLRVASNLGGGSFKAQFKRADKSAARYALVLGEAELAENRAQIKPLRSDEAQVSVALEKLPEHLQKLCIDVEKPQSD